MTHWLARVLPILSGTFLLVALLGCQSTRAQAVDRTFPEPREPQYVTGELLLKLQPDAGALVEAARAAGKLPTQTGLAWFDELNARYEVSAIQRLFTQQPDVEAIKHKYPERAHRAPPDAKIPSLKYIYKLTLRQDADVLQAAQEYAAHPEAEYAEPNYLATIQHHTVNPP